ncbi:MAG: NTP transferase domain-containing protein [Candidatus Adiutrix sp.]|jgi:NDP-sugar pyrophosphorylase family protein|nr:NTP transferase domain-containing protein [Candidatus Adiutrix sp.]
MIKTAMIMGAGAGRRLRPLSLVRPKPLFQVLNKTMLEWWAEFLSSAGIRKVVINVHYQSELMLERIERLSASFEGRLTILASPEDEILGTGGGLKKAAPLLGKNDFMVVNADIFTDFELVRLALKHLANPGRLATLGLLENAHRANVSVGEGGRLLGFRSEEALPGELSRQTYCGVMAMSPDIFELIPDGHSDIVDVFNRVLAEGRDIFGWAYDPAIWRDMGTPEDYWDLNRRLAAGRTITHSTAKVEGRLAGWNVLGAESRVDKGASVENSVIWPFAVVSSGAVVKNAVVSGLLPPGRVIEGGVFCDTPGR